MIIENSETTVNYKLTEYSHGAGWGCKLSPAVLDQILHGIKEEEIYPNLLVGNKNKDDSAAYQLDDDNVILCTTDFFMPIVDDPYTFGRIAATNAISDIYAMGAKPLVALAIFAWPINKLPAEVATEVLRGGRDTCKEAGIALAGGHSIDCPEPIFGLAVTGHISKKRLKTNNQATANCQLYLTKPLGIGILTTAQKAKKIEDNDLDVAIDVMTTLNKFGSKLGNVQGVTAITDVTGFGLLGHLVEICEASNISAVINLKNLPLLAKTEYYIEKECIPGGTLKNYLNYKDRVNKIDSKTRDIICDPQTSGGLLIAVQKEHCSEFERFAQKEGLDLKAIGYTQSKSEFLVNVE